MISGCDKEFFISSFWSAVLAGRNQLFETTKRGGAGLVDQRDQATRLTRHASPRRRPWPWLATGK